MKKANPKSELHRETGLWGVAIYVDGVYKNMWREVFLSRRDAGLNINMSMRFYEPKGKPVLHLKPVPVEIREVRRGK